MCSSVLHLKTMEDGFDLGLEGQSLKEGPYNIKLGDSTRPKHAKKGDS